MKGNSKRIIQIVLYLLLYISSLGIIIEAAILYKQGIAKILNITIVGMIMTGCILLQYAVKKKRITRSFLPVYYCGLIMSCLFPLLPSTGWVFPAIFLGLVLFSTTSMAIVTGSIFLGYTLLLSGESISIWMLYFAVGITVVIIFAKLDEQFQIGYRLFIVIMIFMVVLLAMTVFVKQDMINIESLMIPLLNLFTNMILFAGLLKLYSAKVIHKEKNLYDIINDQEYELVKELKDNHDIYYNAIHTAYFCEKIARKLELNVDLAKAGAYYHKILPFVANEKEISVKELCQEHHFPNEVYELLAEYNDKSVAIQMKEATIVYIADSIVTSIMYSYKKEPGAIIDYNKLIMAIFKRREESGILNQSNISIRELKIMEQIFTGEKLYYDFLH